MKLPELQKEIRFLIKDLPGEKQRNIHIVFEHLDEENRIRTRPIKYVEYDERFNQLVFVEQKDDEDKDAIRLTDKYSRD